jgi:hypothetical protein
MRRPTQARAAGCAREISHTGGGGVSGVAARGLSIRLDVSAVTAAVAIPVVVLVLAVAPAVVVVFS